MSDDEVYATFVDLLQEALLSIEPEYFRLPVAGL
jgi:hypothetical protein